MSRSLTSVKVSETHSGKTGTTSMKDAALVLSPAKDSANIPTTIMKQNQDTKTEDNTNLQIPAVANKICANCDQKMAVNNGTNRCVCKKGKLPYQQLLWTMENDSRWKAERSQGRIVGMYKMLGEIGAGNFAKVKLGIHQLTKEKVAIKIIDKARIEPKMQKMLTREVATFEAVNHRNLVRLFEVLETTNRVYLISEWAPAGDLYSKVTLKGFLTELEAKPIFQQILAAVTYLHAHEIIHRDLKAENVFFVSTTSLKVGDFGFSTSARNGRQLTTFCGSPPYAAPELFRDESYEGWAVDVWALGVLIYFMVEGSLPFVGSSIPTLKKSILSGHYTTSDHLSQECVSLIHGILTQKVSQRYNLSKIIRHPWLASVRSPADIERSEVLYRLKKEVSPGPTQTQMIPHRKDPLPLTRQDTLNLLLPKQKPLSKTIPSLDQVNSGLLTAQEVQALKLLQFAIGVDQRLIDAHRAAGVRSHVVGIYRIILHKLQQGFTYSPKDFYVPECYATSYTCATAKKNANKSTKKGSLRATGIVAHIASTGKALVPSSSTKGSQSKSVHSNTCSIL